MKIEWEKIVDTITGPLVKEGASQVSRDILAVVMMGLGFFLLYFLLRK